MSLPTPAARPATPPPGAPAPELAIATLRGHAGRLVWSVLLLVAVAAAAGFFYGNLPRPFEDWMLLSAAALLILLGVVVPYVVWLSRTYTITTRRVIGRRGLLARSRTELSHGRGYTVGTRRSVLQRMRGTGTLTLSDGLGGELVMKDVPSAVLVGEVLADQVEMNQILAHRDSQGVFGA
ncbi:PH domain-containing protein [Microbacterium marinilacus]|uniref:YdbS-like PH domain-containing protein n=1 Tax=Microbacterium marinilacus TaxID=415209 RepID=A0ABP7BC03_9MICO|nr:PH domain-containing protein [Microbacterium marinilacus]MBY0687177.1 PH domain-containing protein [Microbacterium marinilacus]